ncbi:translation elongation factor Ts [Puniceicoccaceae bacterium K14]|nr:translation elongation factor Ts [Puniceicoccaceae bacterium K14]
MSVKISAKQVSELRQMTGAGLMDCKKALTETDGDVEKAVTILRTKGMASASKKAGRATSEGLIESYIHLGGKVGVLLEINCETDFVAKNEDFKSFVKDVCLHIAAVSPVCVSRDSVPTELVEKEREIAMAQAEGKPAAAIQKIVEGKLNKYYSSICLLDQPFVKDSDKTVQEILTEKISQLGENMVIRRFSRFQMGEDLAGESAE